MNTSLPGFNGAYGIPIDATYPLGNGFRAYNPEYMRFYCPDSWSPFGGGGINTYAYCTGDPVNRTDPSGHHSVLGWLGISAGLALGAILTPVSGGTSLAVALSVISVTAGVVSAGMGIAQQFVEGANPATGAALGWAALGTGIFSALGSITLSRIASGTKSLAGLIKCTNYGRLNEIVDQIAATSTTATHPELDIMTSIHGADYANNISVLAQHWGTTDLKSVNTVFQSMKSIPLRNINADEIYLYGAIRNGVSEWSDEGSLLIFNSKKLHGTVEIKDYVKVGDMWQGKHSIIKARKLTNGGIGFLMSHNPNLRGPILIPDGEGVNIRSKLSDVFRLKGRVLSNKSSIMSWSVFIQMPPQTGLPYELI